jgi:hypothetical protein
MHGRKIAGGLLAAAVAAGTAYAVPTSAQAAPAQAPDPGHHLSPRLSAVVSADKPGGVDSTDPQLSEPQTGAGSLLRTPDGRRLVVDVRLSSRDDATIQAIEAAGARLLPQPQGYGRLAVSVLPTDLTALGDVAGVQYVGEELTPMVNAVCDATISQGDAILHANQLRATGVDGTGVKVGVMSDSYNKATAPFTNAGQDIASDNLPGAANACGHTSVSTVADKPTAGTDEGRGMMQIVHDLAPGSPLDFATAFISEASFAANITQLANQGAKVIVDDVTYFDEPMYQDGIVEQAVSGVRARNVDYFTSSANNRYVKNGHEVGSYEAVNGYRPTTCPTIIPAHADCHNFGTAGSPDSTFGFNYTSGQTIRPILDWAEAWDGGVHTDLDMYLIDQTTNTVINTGGSQVNNLTSQQAFEFFGGSLGTNDNLALVIARKSAAAPATTPRFKMVFASNGAQPFNTLEHETPVVGTGDVMGPTAFGHNGGADAMSVGASDVRVATNLNSYSSYGPVTTLFGPVNGATPAPTLGTPRVVNKPDIVASDCNVTTFFAGAGPPFHFCGTSAAAPHAAAVAALLRQKFPSASANTINNSLISTADPIAGVPASFQGGGLVNAVDAASAFPPPPAPNTILTKFPKHTVTTTKRKTKVGFQFTSTIAGSTFACSIDGKAFAPCTSGVTYKLKTGKHTFAVRATAAGVTDPTPATYSFKIKRKRHHHHHH